MKKKEIAIEKCKDCYTPIEFDDNINVSDNYYADYENNKWLVSSLIQLVKEQELVPFKLPLQCIDTGLEVWSGRTVYKLARHVKRAYKTDMSHPVIMNENGFIMDGWHRILRALIEDKEYVWAVRFTKTPIPDIQSNETNS